MKKGFKIAAETPATEVGIGERLRGSGYWLAIQALIKYAFDGSVFRACKRERAFARCLGRPAGL